MKSINLQMGSIHLIKPFGPIRSRAFFVEFSDNAHSNVIIKVNANIKDFVMVKTYPVREMIMDNISKQFSLLF